ncbi:MAG TPA: hypothetical protein ENI53_01200 [Thermoplasmatales archaeon]|nr:hypothetical protein [Thermoplasmatales archaeon]
MNAWNAYLFVDIFIIGDRQLNTAQEKEILDKTPIPLMKINKTFLLEGIVIITEKVEKEFDPFSKILSGMGGSRRFYSSNG